MLLKKVEISVTMPSTTLTHLDETTIHMHRALDTQDVCYYWRQYTSGVDYTYSDTNQLIKNLKISPQEKHRLRHKNQAISTIAEEMKTILTEDIFKSYTFVPIPPSKIKSNPEYNDKTLAILLYLKKKYYPSMDIRELITQQTDFLADHELENPSRKTVTELIDNYLFEKELELPEPKKILIFDDVISCGRHFKAVKKLLMEKYPTAEIKGLFIARTVNQFFENNR